MAASEVWAAGDVVAGRAESCPRAQIRGGDGIKGVPDSDVHRLDRWHLPAGGAAVAMGSMAASGTVAFGVEIEDGAAAETAV